MKKSRLYVLVFLIVMVFSFAGCGGDSVSDDTVSGEAEAVAEDGVFNVGDTWIVDGQWEFTIDSVVVTEERNEFEESNPAQVIIIGYSYENLGYEDSYEIMDGLYIDLSWDAQLIDSDGNMCDSYPLGDLYAQETPVGAKCSAESCYGLVVEGSPVKLIISVIDGNGDDQEATYELAW